MSAAAPVPPPRQTNKALWWILGIFAAGFLVVVIGALALVGFILHRVHVTQSANRVEIETPAGVLKVDQNHPGSTGLPLYPGAELQKSQGANIEFSSNDARGGLAVEKYHSSDSRDTVKEWYAKRLGPSFRLETGQFDTEKNQKYPVDMKAGDVAFVDDHGNGARVVALKDVDGGTEIVLLRVGRKEPQ